MKINWLCYNALEYFDSRGKEANPFYTSILDLDKRLTEAGIPHVLQRVCDGWQIIYPSLEEREGDVVAHFGSYGHEEDLIEAYGFNFQDVKGWLSVDDAFNLIKNFNVKRRR